MKVLFICKSNQFRSQMAAALYNKLTNTTDGDSAGTNVGPEMEPEGLIIEKNFRTSDFFELLEENGMFIRNHKTKALTPELLKQYDSIVSMADEPYIPDFLKSYPNVHWWKVEDPSFATREVSETTYNVIKGYIQKDLLHK